MITNSILIRYATLDAIRGVAVMGILLANVVAFGLPESAYFSPLSWGGAAGADRVTWLTTFVLVEGRMRGLFSFLFGASMVLVIERAEAAGRSGAATHLARMAVLFAIGCAHLYLFWWGDILAHYAIVGTVALMFVPLGARTLVACAAAALAFAIWMNVEGALALFASVPRATAAQMQVWDGFSYAFGVPPRAHLQAEMAALRGGFGDAVRWRWAVATDPFTFARYAGAETLSAMLLGMAAFRSGFVTGGWSPRRYAWIAATAVPVSLAGYAALGLMTMAHGFAMPWVFLGAMLASQPLRVLGYVGYAALLVLAVRRGGTVVEWLRAVGRMAFSNYLLTTLAMDLAFCGWGLGQFARIDRAALYLLVPPLWLAMLLWSPWWLHRFAHGPLEWLWRTLARGRCQPMRLAAGKNREV